ncbi:MAG: hypothetical protein LUD12_13315 [Lachnospiraceae bacterium]|nr:hypothetical protein [Lachnospiraceae bacterium]
MKNGKTELSDTDTLIGIQDITEDNRMKPILFNTAMVRAVQEGRKTATRRIIKKMPPRTYRFEQIEDDKWEYFYGIAENDIVMDLYGEIRAPYKPGDILYVREAWNHGYIESSDIPGSCETWFEESKIGCGGYIGTVSSFYYRANIDENEANDIGMKWKPSIHMPKEAARIWLQVISVRPQRLQDITDDQSEAEGISDEWACEWWKPTYNDPDSGGYPKYREAFGELWNATVKKAELGEYGWKANPWVWVIEFERCEKPEE